jgi:hypothetical protein
VRKQAVLWSVADPCCYRISPNTDTGPMENWSYGGDKFPGSPVSVCVVGSGEPDNEVMRWRSENAAVSMGLVSRAQSGDQ